MVNSTVTGAAAAPQCRQNDNKLIGDLKSLVVEQGRELKFLEARVAQNEDKFIDELRGLVVEQGREIKFLKDRVAQADARLAALEISIKYNGGVGNSANRGSNALTEARLAALENSIKYTGGGENVAPTNRGINVGNSKNSSTDVILTEFRQKLLNKRDSETQFAEDPAMARAKRAFWNKSVDVVDGSQEKDRMLLTTDKMNANATLLSCISILNDKDASMDSRNQMASILRDLALPSNEGTQKSLGTAGRRTTASGIKPILRKRDCSHLQPGAPRKKVAMTAIDQPSKKERKPTISEELAAGIGVGFQVYKIRRLGWGVPDDFNFPKLKLRDAWTAYLIGFPNNKTLSTNDDGSPVLDEHGQQVMVPAPIGPLRFLADYLLPKANSKSKCLRKNFHDHWRPILKYMHNVNRERIANTQSDEMDHDFVQATCKTGIDALQDEFPELFTGKNASRCQNWNISTWNKWLKKLRRERKKTIDQSNR